MYMQKKKAEFCNSIPCHDIDVENEDFVGCFIIHNFDTLQEIRLSYANKK